MPGSHITDHQSGFNAISTKERAAGGCGEGREHRHVLPRGDPRPPPGRSRSKRPDPLAGIFDEEIVPLLEHTPHSRGGL